MTYLHCKVSEKRTLVVNIDARILETLKCNGYVLCIAKMVNNAFTVIWKGKQDILRRDTFQWTPKYELFGVNKCSSGLLVKPSTNTVLIQGNETCVLPSSCQLKAPYGTPDASQPFYMLNDYGVIYPGVNMINEDGGSSPIYVAQKPAICGKLSLLPVEKIRVWFEQNVQTSTIISNITKNYIDLDFTVVNSHEITYGYDEKWEQISYDHNTFLMLPCGQIKTAITVKPKDVVRILVAFKPYIELAARTTLTKYMRDELTKKDVFPGITFPDGSKMDISVPKCQIMAYIMQTSTVPNYKYDVNDILKSAKMKGILAQDETWITVYCGNPLVSNRDHLPHQVKGNH